MKNDLTVVATALSARFPWLSCPRNVDHELSGSDVIQELEEWYRQLGGAQYQVCADCQEEEEEVL